jgi:hypothetical protein
VSNLRKMTKKRPSKNEEGRVRDWVRTVPAWNPALVFCRLSPIGGTSMEITASMVKELRERTSVSMGECKKTSLGRKA